MPDANAPGSHADDYLDDETVSDHSDEGFIRLDAANPLEFERRAAPAYCAPYRGPKEGSRRLAPEFLARALEAAASRDKRGEQNPGGEGASPRDVDRPKDGCEASPSCGDCDLVICRYDVRGGLPAARARTRNVEIERLRDAGQSAAEIAGAVGVAKRTVERALKQALKQARAGAPKGPALGAAR